MGQQERSFVTDGSAKWRGHFGRQFLVKLNTTLPYNLARTLLGTVYPSTLQIYVHTKVCRLVFIVALFIIAKTWEQLGRHWMGYWTNKLLDTQFAVCSGMLVSDLKKELASCEKT